MKSLLVLVLISIWTAAGGVFASAAGQGKWQFQEKQFTTNDGLTLTAWLAAPKESKKAPLLVLLHMLGRTHDSYNPFIKALRTHLQSDSANENNTLPYLLNFDLRGHGKSTAIGETRLHHGSMGDANFKKIPNDISVAVQHVLADSTLNIDSNNIMIMGASIGANSAAMVTELLTGVQKVVMLSPGENYRGLEPARAVKDFKGKMLIYTAEGDEYPTSSSRKLADLNKKSTTLRIFKGRNHGTNIIDNDPEAMQYLLEWLLNP